MSLKYHSLAIEEKESAQEEIFAPALTLLDNTEKRFVKNPTFHDEATNALQAIVSIQGKVTVSF